MSKGRGNPQTALDQVAHTEHPDEAFNAVGDAVVFVMLAASVPWSVLAYGIHERPNQRDYVHPSWLSLVPLPLLLHLRIRGLWRV